MKAVFTLLVVLFTACSSGNNKNEPIDTMNGIPDPVLMDTPSSSPNGYAPPNSQLDSTNKNDSGKESLLK